MDRLLEALDGLVDSGAVTDELVVQAAAYRYRPRHAVLEGIRPFGWLRDQIATADVVISHAGPGTLALIRSMGRVPVVVPRSAAAGEHVDDHQLRYAEHLRRAPGYIVVTDLGGLAAALETARTSHARPEPADVSRAVSALEALLGGAA